MTDSAITPLDTRPPLATERQQLYCQARQSTALAGGIEALSARAIDEGDITPEQLEDIASLSAQLRERLERLTHTIAENGPAC